MGRAVAQTVAARLGRSLLELGGNNGMIVTPSADLELAVRSIVFAAAGTCGQRCTTLRRLIVHESIADQLRDRIIAVYQRLPIGDPTQDGVLCGPLIDAHAFEAMQSALDSAREQGGKVHGGERVTNGVPSGGYYVRPALVEITADAPITRQETFAPILYFMRYDNLDEAIELHNTVPQGLSSAIVTRRLARSGIVLFAGRLRLRHREREPRHQRGGNRRRLRRRKGNRRRPRIGLRRLEALHAPRHQHRELLRRTAAGARHSV